METKRQKDLPPMERETHCNTAAFSSQNNLSERIHTQQRVGMLTKNINNNNFHQKLKNSTSIQFNSIQFHVLYICVWERENV